jgi:hypothetical protein
MNTNKVQSYVSAQLESNTTSDGSKTEAVKAMSHLSNIRNRENNDSIRSWAFQILPTAIDGLWMDVTGSSRDVGQDKLSK